MPSFCSLYLHLFFHSSLTINLNSLSLSLSCPLSRSLLLTHPFRHRLVLSFPITFSLLSLFLLLSDMFSLSFSMLCHSHTFLLTPSVHFTLWLYFILPLTPPFTNFLSLNFAFYIFLSLSLEISLSLILSISFPLSFSVSFSLPPYTLCSVYRSRSYFSHSLCRAFFFPLHVQSLSISHSTSLRVPVCSRCVFISRSLSRGVSFLLPPLSCFHRSEGGIKR